MRSAMRPAVAAPMAQPISAMAMTWASSRRADVVAAPDGLDGAVDHGAVVAEEEAAHRGGRRDEDDMAEMLADEPSPGSVTRVSARCWSRTTPRATGNARRVGGEPSQWRTASADHHLKVKTTLQRLCLQVSKSITRSRCEIDRHAQHGACVQDCEADEAAAEGRAQRSRWLITFETPSPCMETPYSASATSIVRFWCVITMSCEALLELLHDPDQPLQVGVVERRLDLVHHVERARPGLEDRHQQRHGRQRPLAAGQQRQPLDLLARRPGLDVDAGGEHVVRDRSGSAAPRRRGTAGRRHPRTRAPCPGTPP